MGSSRAGRTLRPGFRGDPNWWRRRPNRFGPWLPIAVVLLATAMALRSLATLQVDSPHFHLRPAFVLIGLGIGLVVTAATEAIVGNTPVDEAGVAAQDGDPSAVNSTFLLRPGRATSVPATGLRIDHGKRQSPSA